MFYWINSPSWIRHFELIQMQQIHSRQINREEGAKKVNATVVLILSRSICQIFANFSGVEFLCSRPSQNIKLGSFTS